MGELVKAAKTNSIAKGSAAAVEIGGKAVGVFNVDGKFYAIDSTCGHRGGPLNEGELDGNVITCPWHGFQFDVTTGNCATNPALKQACYPVRIEGDDILIEI